jgi:hypothetical protein
MVKFKLIHGWLDTFHERLNEFFEEYPDAVLVNVDLKSLRALVMYEE